VDLCTFNERILFAKDRGNVDRLIDMKKERAPR
jgi:hypothetical protein